METLAGFVILLVILAISVFFTWLFYIWGASIAEGKGRPRSLGWWAVFFGIFAIIVLALLPPVERPVEYIPHTSAKTDNVAEQLERLASLRDKGALTSEEFEERKRILLDRT